jgi:hypothetical protein
VGDDVLVSRIEESRHDVMNGQFSGRSLVGYVSAMQGFV